MDIELEALEEKARYLVTQKHYKDAIACYQQLWVADKAGRWRQAMAECFLARAREFAGRNMYQQAVEQWRQYQPLTESESKVLPEVVLWQLGADNIKAAEALLGQLEAAQLDQADDFGRIMALLILTEYPELREALPGKSQFVSDLNNVESALQCLSDDSLSLSYLQKLPESSVFRDIADFITAILTHDASVSISSESILYACAQILPLLRLQGVAFVAAMVGLNARQRQCVYRLRKLQPEQQQFIERYVEKAGSVDEVQQFDWVMQFKSLVGVDMSLAFCRATLPNDFLRWLKFKKQFQQCSVFELCRLKALACERSDDYRAAEQHWLDAINCLARNSDNDLKIALILRHIAGFYPLDEQKHWLQDSLRYDEDDIETREQLEKLEPQTFIHSDGQDTELVDDLAGLFSVSPEQQQALWDAADELMMAFTPEQLAQEFQPEAEENDLEQMLARTPALMDGLLLLKAARQLGFKAQVTVKQLVKTLANQ